MRNGVSNRPNIWTINVLGDAVTVCGGSTEFERLGRWYCSETDDDCRRDETAVKTASVTTGGRQGMKNKLRKKLKVEKSNMWQSI